MEYFLIFTLTILTCVLGQGLVQSFNLNLPQAAEQIRKGLEIKASEPYLHDTARRLIPSYVRHFQQTGDRPTPRRVSNLEKRSKLFSSLLFHGAPILAQRPVQDSNKLSDPFRWESCGSSPQIMEIKSLSVKPDPLQFPGSISFSFDIAFHESISSSENVTVALDVYMKSRDSWYHFPCLGPVGSCTYVDFCQLIEGNSCPGPFTTAGVPCKCPFNKGEYKLSDFTIDIDAEVLLQGDYKAKAQVSSDKKGNIACYEIFLSVR